MPESENETIGIRPFAATDAPFLASVAQRLHPGATASPRDVNVMAQFLDRLPRGQLLAEPGSEAFVAAVNGAPAGVVALRPDADHFTGHARAYVEILVVAEEAEGKGVGRALMRQAEQWARDHGCLEVVLDVFVGNTGAIAFYERAGYLADHIRMTKSLI